MAALALVAAIVAAAALLLPAPGYLAGFGLAVVAATAGLLAFRDRARPGRGRIAGAAALGLAAAVLLVAGAKYGLTLVALGRLASLR